MRAEWIKIICGIIVLMLSISGFGLISGNKTLEEFKSGSSFEITFPVGGGSNNQSIIQLPIDANVQSATMVLEGEPVAGTYPSHVAFDVGEDGVIEWKFDEIGSGSWGWQNTFWNGVNNTPLNMGQILYNHTVGVRLPAGVTIDTATLDFWAEEQDYMDSVVELNLPGGGLAGPYDDVHDYDPIVVVFQNKLLDIYRTHSDLISNGTDGDLVVNWTLNGIDWIDHNEVTKVSDGTWPWDNTRAHWWGMDMRPNDAIFNNRLYLAWESNSTKVGPHWPGITIDPDDNRGITSGYDKDIVITSSADGITWSDNPANFIEITSPELEDGNTSGGKGYNTAQPMPQDWLPQIATFNPGSGDRLYCLWATNNTDTPKEWYGGADLMVTWSDDPDSPGGWNDTSRVVNLTPGDAWNGSDFNPKLIVFDDKLFAIWQTNDTSRGNGSDYDILLRYTEDGDTWSSTTYQVSPKGMNDWTEEYYNNEFKQEFWDMTPEPIVFNNKLGIVWETENFLYTYNRTWNQSQDDQTDADIVVAWSSDGISWDLDFGTNIFEITQAENDWGDHYPNMITLDPDGGTGPQAERLYAAWNSNDKGISIWDYDIMYTYSTDGENWKPQRFASTHPDFGGGDYLAHMAEYKGWLYVTYWSFDDKDGPKQGMYADGDDADVLVRRIVPSYLPVPNVSMNVNNDGTNEFGPGMLSQSVQTLDIKSSLQATVNSASTFHTDLYSNDYVDVVFNVSSPDVPCRLWLADLDIKYTKTGGKFFLDVVDFSDALNEYIRVHQSDADAADGVLDIPIKLSSESQGKLVMKNINIIYNQKPTIQITSPGDSLAFAKTNFTITWTAADPDDTDADITLYIDSDNKEGGEVEIDTSGSPITVSSDTYFNWDTSAIELGKEYYIKAVIDDGIDTAYDYGNSKVRITRDNVPPTITLLSPTASHAKTEFDYWVSWVDSDEDSNAWITLYYDTDTDPSSGKTLIVDKLREDHKEDRYHWIIGDDVGIGKYYIYAEISDEENTTYDYSDGYVELITPSLQKPVNINIKNNLDTPPTLRTHDLLPELFWQNSPFNPLPNATNLINYKYIVDVGTSQSTPDDLLKNWETSDTNVVLANDLSFGEAYFIQVVVSDGRGHYSASAESTFEIANNPPSSPEIRITPGDPTTESTLTVEIVNASVDPDKDLVKYEYSWFKGQSEETKYAGKVSISPEDTKKGDVWKVFVTPYDMVNGLKQATGDSSTESVVIGNAAPRPEITVPENNTEYEQGTTIKFIGNANDPDSDDSATESLTYTWKSDLDGTISTGQDSEIEWSKLSIGRHTITLEIVNEDEVVTSSIWVKVIKPPKDPKDESDDGGGISTAALAGIGIIIVVVILIVVLFFLMRRRGGKEEPLYPELDDVHAEELPEGPSAEQLYGEDMPGTEDATPEIAPPGGDAPPEQLPPGPDEGAEGAEAGDVEAPEEPSEPSEPQPEDGGALPDAEQPETVE